MVSIAEKIGRSAHTLLEWVKEAEVDSGKRASVPTDVAEKLKALERQSREFAQTELGPLRLPCNGASHRRNLLGRLRPFRK